MKILKYCLTILMAALVVCSSSIPVNAATDTLTLDAMGVDQFVAPYVTVSYVGGANYTVLNSDDAGASYVNVNFSWTGSYIWTNPRGCYSATAFASGHSAINSVTVIAKIYHPYVGTVTDYVYYRTSGSYWLGGSGTVVPSTTWTTVQYTWKTCPATGFAWTVADINSNEFGAQVQCADTGGANGTFISFLSVQVNYEPPLVPTVTTQAVTAVTETTATGNGNVTSDGGGAITERGTVISTSANPTTADHKDTAAGTTGVFTTSITALTAATTYHVRAFATNITGTSYGTDVSFTTWGNPSVTTVDASNVTTATAQLNALVVSDGGQLCDIRFAWDTSSHALFADYANITAWVSDTYSTGDYPYVNISGLVPLTTYHFRAQVRNDVSTQTGGDVEFVAANAVSYPTLITSIPYSTKVNVTWIKGSGASNTILRYATSTYPLTSSSGTLGYSGTGNSVIIAGLTPGTTIYMSFWGLTSGTYSTSYATSAATTLAYDQALSGGPTLATPTPDTTWTQNPSAAKVATIPVVGEIIQMDATAFNQPVEYLWYFVWMMAAAVVGIAVYMGGGHNFALSGFSMLAWIGIGVWWLNVVAGGVLALIAIIGIAWSLVGFRRVGG